MKKRVFGFIIILLLLVLLFGCSKKEENLTGNAVNGKSVLSEMGSNKFFTGSFFQKVKNFFKKEAVGKVLQTSKSNIIYGGLPTKEYITKVEAWKDIPECKFNLNKEVNEIRSLFLDGKNEEWLDQLGLWEDKVLCTDSITLLEIDKVLGGTIKQLANDARGKNLDTGELGACNNFNAILQPSWLVMDFTLHTGNSLVYKELQASQDVGKQCNFYYPKVSFPFVAWNIHTGDFDLYGLICEKNKKNPECYASHDFFWTFALKPVNYGVGCHLSDWADTGFICGDGVSFNSPGKLLIGELKDGDIVYNDNQNTYVSPLGISGKDILLSMEAKCKLKSSSGAVGGKVGTGVGSGAKGLVKGKGVSGSTNAGVIKGEITGSGVTGLEERLSTLILPLLPCAGGSGKGWEGVGNAMKNGCTAFTGGMVNPATEAEERILAGTNSLGCASRYPSPSHKPPILFSSRLQQHGISGPGSKSSGCGGVSDDKGVDGAENTQKGCAEEDNAKCGKKVEDGSSEQNSLIRKGAYDQTGKKSDDAKYKIFAKKDAGKTCGDSTAVGCVNGETNTIFLRSDVVNGPDNKPVAGSGSPIAGDNKDRYTPEDVIKHERDHIDNPGATEGQIRTRDVLNRGVGANFVGSNGQCSGAFDNALGQCIGGTGPTSIDMVSRADWCKYAECDQPTGKSPPKGASSSDAPVVKDPSGGLGGDTRGESYEYDGGMLCAEALLGMFGMIDCEINTEQSAASGGGDTSFCSHGLTFDQGETQNPAEGTQDSRCGSVASEFECGGAELGMSKMKSLTTMAQTGKSLTKGTIS